MSTNTQIQINEKKLHSACRLSLPSTHAVALPSKGKGRQVPESAGCRPCMSSPNCPVTRLPLQLGPPPVPQSIEPFMSDAK